MTSVRMFIVRTSVNRFLGQPTPESKRFGSLFISDIARMEYTPAPIGVQVRGVNLASEMPRKLIDQIQDDVHTHRLLIFKDQGIISAERHVEISRWFGELESTFYKHPRSPHPDVFRVSNDENEGCKGVGRTGWHIDGSFMVKPFSYALYHMVSIPESGDTTFINLTQLVESLTPEKRQLWQRLWMVSDSRQGVIHPLVYPHPVTGMPTVCFHLGMTESFIWDRGTDQERETNGLETYNILQDIQEEITKDNRSLIYSHKWEPGDFIISDNLAVGHEATPETQLPRSKVGLRVLHRTTVAGKFCPSKTALP